MSSFFCNSLIFVAAENTEELLPPSHCGTAACIAGWAIHLNGGLKTPKETYEHSKDDAAYYVNFYSPYGARVLGLSSREGDRLFLIGSWPVNFAKRYYLAKTPKTRAKAAADRITHFIKTKGQE